MFKEDGIFNYSTMLIRDDLDVLLLGAREAIYALDINNISIQKDAVRSVWRVITAELAGFSSAGFCSKTTVCRAVYILTTNSPSRFYCLMKCCSQKVEPLLNFYGVLLQ